MKHIKVKVSTGSSTEKVIEINPGVFKISVRPKPFGGAANKRATELLAKHLGVTVSKVRLVKGHKLPSKVFEVFTF